MTSPSRGFERRVMTTAAIAIVPLAILTIVFAWTGDFDLKWRWTIVTIAIAAIFTGTFVLYEQVTFPLRTLTNLIAALREGDFTLRARHIERDDVLGQAMTEINQLSDVLEARNIAAIEAGALLRAVLEEIDSAIFAFDHDSRLRLVNPAAERLFGTTAERAIGRTAAEIGVEDLLRDDGPDTLDMNGRWRVRRSTFRQHGLPHRLLVLTDITRALREEEALAWQRLVRVLGHELNNSLTPIMSIAQSVDALVSREPLPVDWRDDVQRGTRVISGRADSLTRFLRAYAQVARLPQPKKTTFDIAELIARVAALETRTDVQVSGPSVVISADADQIEQLMINLIRNAADASPVVAVQWHARRAEIEIRVLDEGTGVSSTANLFVPFFTTKPGGTGIGLLLSRQIAEAHGGNVTLENRKDGRGAVARVRLPRG